MGDRYIRNLHTVGILLRLYSAEIVLSDEVGHLASGACPIRSVIVTTREVQVQYSARSR